MCVCRCQARIRVRALAVRSSPRAADGGATDPMRQRGWATVRAGGWRGQAGIALEASCLGSDGGMRLGVMAGGTGGRPLRVTGRCAM